MFSAFSVFLGFQFGAIEMLIPPPPMPPAYEFQVTWHCQPNRTSYVLVSKVQDGTYWRIQLEELVIDGVEVPESVREPLVQHAANAIDYHGVSPSCANEAEGVALVT
ncbi:hypothetical protein [Sphingomicrobium clamense]|uniref:DUF5086 domain-containing protein n=1 Tax=Sphingomicrobium clamense TaxID=2851013 RepID=A0ABS6V6D2_9SPHN|nr:hypothetical protein [Sphingomicrobium sp. B8]MBW0145074.1 hypothetical protein [Sphingomicrobium sp. B8]